MNDLTLLSLALTPQPQDRGGQGNGPTPNVRASEAWRREMERAQLASWFRPAPARQQAVAMLRTDASLGHAPAQMRSPANIGLDHTAYNTGANTAQPDSGAAPRPLRPMGMVAAMPSGKNQPLASPGAPSIVEIRALLSRTVLAWPARTPAASATELASRTDPMPYHAGMRIHVEQEADNVAVWIGASPDDPVVRQHLPLLLDALQRSLLDKGLRLSTLTLNGRIVWQSSFRSNSDALKEAPWLSAQ